MHHLRRMLGRSGLVGIAFGLAGLAAYLQLTVHDPHHILLTILGSWGMLSLPIGLLVGHFALSED